MHRLLVSLALAFALTIVFASFSAVAQNVAPPSSRGPEVELQAESAREVTNDLMHAVLFAEASDTNSAQLAGTLNRTVNAALAAGGEVRSVQVRSGNVQTFPVYDRAGKLTNWRGRAEVRLEGREFRDVAALIARLQSSMQLAGVSFSVSPEARRKVEDELVGEAIAAFRARAEIVRQAIGGQSARIRRIAVNAGGDFPAPRPMAAQMRGASVASAPIEAPTFEGGTSRVVVTVAGTAEIE